MAHFSDSEAARLLQPWNVDRPELVGEGMEGAVYLLGPDQVAKIWFAHEARVVRSMKDFYDALAAKNLPFATPRIAEVREEGGHTVSVERRIEGVVVQAALDAGEISRDRAMDMVVAVLAELAGSGGLPEARTLGVLGDVGPLWPPGGDFTAGLVDLARRRAKQFGGVLAAAVDDFDRKTEALLARIPEVDSGARTVIHGDLVLPNLLTTDLASVHAVLDWGFLTTEGDPAFDAAVAAAIFDMYGPDALKTELALYEQLEEALGYARADLLVYRAAYSLITANAYDPLGRDGHFAWCAAALNRPDVVAAIGL